MIELRRAYIEEKIYLCHDAEAFGISGAAAAHIEHVKIQELLEAHSNKAF